jgi:hypothetical protein
MEQHPLVRDTFTVITNDLGIGNAASVCATASIEAVTRTTLETASSALRGSVTHEFIEDEANYRLWTALWRNFRLRAPQRFVLDGATVAEDVPAAALAYVYARQNGAIGLSKLSLALDEAILLKQARSQLANWTGVAQFTAPAESWTFNDRCLPLRSLKTLDGWIGMSFAEVEALRNHVILDGRFIEQQRQEARENVEVCLLVLHEEIHSTLALAEGAVPPLFNEELTAAVSEGGTSLLELAAVLTASNRAASPDALRIPHGYQQQVGALLDLFPGSNIEALAAEVYRLLVSVVRR